MDSFQFSAAIVQALAWPTAAVVLGATLRRSIVDLLARVTSLKAGGIEMTVAERSVTAVENLPPAPAPTPTLPPLKNTNDPAIDDVPADVPGTQRLETSEDDARGTILRTWVRLEAALARESGGRSLGTRSAVFHARQLVGMGYLRGSLPAAVDDLRRIKDDVIRKRVRVRMVDAAYYTQAVESVLNAIKLAREYVDAGDDASAVRSINAEADILADIRNLRARFEGAPPDTLGE